LFNTQITTALAHSNVSNNNAYLPVQVHMMYW